METCIVRKVAEKLGNTVATCRKYYIHPDIISDVAEKEPQHLDLILPDPTHQKLLRKHEKMALALLQKTKSL